MSNRLDSVIAQMGPLRDLSKTPFSEAERMFHSGELPEEEWLRYCYEWVTSTARFSDLGLPEAREYAQKNGLPDPGPKGDYEPEHSYDQGDRLKDQVLDNDYPVDDNVPDLSHLRRGRRVRVQAQPRQVDRFQPRASALDRALERLGQAAGAKGEGDDPLGFKSKVSEFKAWLDAAEADLKAAGFTFTQGLSDHAVGHAEEILREIGRAATNLADLMATHKQNPGGLGMGGPGPADGGGLDDGGAGMGPESAPAGDTTGATGPYTGQPIDNPSVGEPLPGV